MSDVCTILAVDDDPAVAQSLAFVLNGPGCKLVSACDGQDALERIADQRQTFDVIITDNAMPRVPGVELVRQLRSANYPGKIIVLSAHLSDEQQAAYEQLKVDLILPKPFGVQQLREAVQNLAYAA